MSGSKDKSVSNWRKKYDLKYRPQTYWPEEALLANIKGQWRKEVIRDAIRRGKVEEIDPILFNDALPDQARRASGRIHPQLMGGEYLPNYDDGEIEIARVTHLSATMDVTSVRARRKGERMTYRVTDEYDHGYACHIRWTKRPLTLRQMILQINHSYTLENDEVGAGLATGFIDFHFVYGADPHHYVDFVLVESEFYPELMAWFKEQAVEWVDRRLHWQKYEDIPDYCDDNLSNLSVHDVTVPDEEPVSVETVAAPAKTRKRRGGKS